MRRRAVRWHGVDDIRLDVLSEHRPLESDQVEVAVEACGLCGTDIAIADGTGDQVPIEPHPVAGGHAPLTLGHEIIGRVITPTSELVGRRVAVWPQMPCGECGEREGGFCASGGHLGITADGGMADVVVARASACVPMAESVPLESAVLCEPLAVVLHAFHSTGVDARGRRVAVVGGGSIGLCAVDAAWFLGASEVIAITHREQTRRAALAAGASRAVAPEDAAGLGVDIVVEASGAASGLNTSLRTAAWRAAILVIGDHHSPDPLDMLTLLEQELRIYGSVGHLLEEDFRVAAEAIGRGELGARARPMTRVSLEDAPDIITGRGDRPVGTKIVVVPTETGYEEK